MRNSALILVATLVTASGCSRAPVITIANQSSLTLSNLVVAGTGFAERVGDLPPDGTREVRVRPSGESGVRLTFDAGTKRVDSGSQGYFEAGGGYRVAVTVGTNLSVLVVEKSRRW